MTLTQILQKIRSAFYTKAETDTKINTALNAKANDSDVVHKNGDETINGQKKFTSEIVITSPHAFRHIFGDYGVFWRHDNVNIYLMLTNSGEQYSSWNTFRPLTVNLATGICNISGDADTVDGSHAWQMQTLSAGGQSHGSVNLLMQCQHNVDGDNYFKLYVGDKSFGTKVDRAGSAGYADICGYSRLLGTYADDGHCLCPDRYDGWNTRLYMTYKDKSVKADSVHVHHADYAARSAGDGVFFISGYQIYVG